MKRYAAIPLLICCALIAMFYWIPAEAQPPAQNHAALFNALPARCIGPANMSGRITDLAVVESDPDRYYVATATGGVWRTIDGGKRIEPVFDMAGSLCIGAVAVSQSNPSVVWVGTGEGNVLRSVSLGDGVYKSTDGGWMWQYMGLKETRHIGRIVIHPKNPDIVYVAAIGHGFGPNKERGLYKTTDGGKTWELSKYINENTGFVDVAMDPSDPDTLYAAAYTMQRDAFSGTTPRVQWSKESGIFKTADAGKTWERLKEGLPDRPMGRVGLTICRKNPDIVYALIQTDKTAPGKGAGGDTEPGKDDKKGDKEEPGQVKGGKGKDNPESGGIYRSTDKGKTWTRVNGLNTQFPFYFGQIRVDPNDDQRVYVLGVPISVSSDGGKTFSTLPAKGVHVDHHALWINPKDSNHLLLGNDGGLYTSKNKGGVWQHALNLPIGQFYAIGVDMSKPYYVYGGLQDNGCWGGPSATRNADGILLDDWFRILGADGFYCQPDPKDPNTIYCESQGGGLNRVTLKDGKPTPKGIKPGGKGGGNRFNWSSPILISPHESKTVYFGGNVLFKSNNRGDAWTTVSPDLTLGNKAGDTGHTLSTLAESPLTQGLLLVGTDDGLIHLSKNDGKDWTNLSDKLPGPKERWITRVEWSAHVEGTAFVTYDRHKNDDLKPYIYKTTDYGATWQPLTGNLPQEGSVYVIRESSKNSNLLFVGTEWGLFGSLDAGKNWHLMQKGIPPKVLVHDLVIHPRDRELVVGTHARSIYILDIAPLEELTPKVLDQDAHLFAVKDAVAFAVKERAKDKAAPVYAGENPPYGATISFYLKENPKGPVAVYIRDKENKLIASPTVAPKTVGLNRVQWDLKPTGGEKLVAPGEYFAELVIGKLTLKQKSGFRVEAP